MIKNAKSEKPNEKTRSTENIAVELKIGQKKFKHNNMFYLHIFSFFRLLLFYFYVFLFQFTTFISKRETSSATNIILQIFIASNFIPLVLPIFGKYNFIRVVKKFLFSRKCTFTYLTNK